MASGRPPHPALSPLGERVLLVRGPSPRVGRGSRVFRLLAEAGDAARGARRAAVGVGHAREGAEAIGANAAGRSGVVAIRVGGAGVVCAGRIARALGPRSGAVLAAAIRRSRAGRAASAGRTAGLAAATASANAGAGGWVADVVRLREQRVRDRNALRSARAERLVRPRTAVVAAVGCAVAVRARLIVRIADAIVGGSFAGRTGAGRAGITRQSAGRAAAAAATAGSARGLAAVLHTGRAAAGAAARAAAGVGLADADIGGLSNTGAAGYAAGLVVGSQSWMQVPVAAVPLQVHMAKLTN